jgi:hypothetical protein
LLAQAAQSVSLETFLAVQKASSRPVIEAILAANGSVSASGTREAAAPKSKQDVAAFLAELEWTPGQIAKFSVTGEALLCDVTAQMCREAGVSDIEIRTLTRRLQQWHKGWGS